MNQKLLGVRHLAHLLSLTACLGIMTMTPLQAQTQQTISNLHTQAEEAEEQAFRNALDESLHAPYPTQQLADFVRRYPASRHRAEAVMAIQRAQLVNTGSYFVLPDGVRPAELWQLKPEEEHMLYFYNGQQFMHDAIESNDSTLALSKLYRRYERLANDRSHDNQDEARYYQAYLDYYMGNYASALEQFNQLPNEPRFSSSVLFYGMQSSFAVGDYETALSIAQNGSSPERFRVSPMTSFRNLPAEMQAEAIRIEGESQLHLGNLTQARARLRDYLYVMPDPEPTTVYNYAVLLTDISDYQSALDTLAMLQPGQLTPDQQAMADKLRQKCEYMLQPEQQVQTITVVRTIEMDTPSTLYLQGIDLYEQQRFAEARDVFSRVIDMGEINFQVLCEAWYWRGQARYQLQDWQGAIDDIIMFNDLKTKLTDHTINVMAYYTLGYSRMQQGKWRLASINFSRHLDRQPDVAHRFDTYGEAQQRLGECKVLMRNERASYRKPLAMQMQHPTTGEAARLRTARDTETAPVAEAAPVVEDHNDLRDYEPPYLTTEKMNKAPQGQVMAIEPKNQNVWLQASLGNELNGELDARWHITPGLLLSLEGQHSRGDLPLAHPIIDQGGAPSADAEWQSRMLTGKAQLEYAHTTFDEMHVHTFAAAQGAYYNVFPFVTTTGEYQQGLPALYHGGDPKTAGKEMFLPSGTALLRQGITYPMAHRNWLRASAGFDISYEQLDIALRYDFSMTSLNKAKQNLLDLKAAYTWTEQENWRATLGARIRYDVNNHQLGWLPRFDLSFLPIDKQQRRWFASVEGGREVSCLGQWMEQAPLLMACSVPTSDGVNGTLGWEDNENGLLRWGFYATAGWHKTAVGSVMTYDVNPYWTAGTPVGTFAQLTSERDMSWGLGAHLEYNPSRYLHAELRADYARHSAKTVAMSIPQLDAEAKVSTQLGNWTLGADFRYGWKRQGAFLSDYDRPLRYNTGELDYQYTMHGVPRTYSDVIDLEDLMDLGASIRWRANEHLDLFGVGRNLLNRKYQLWPGIPALRLEWQAGLTLRF